MRNYRTLTILFLLLGSILMVFSGYRWLNIYNDPSNAFLGILIGGLLILVGYLHQRVSDLTEGQEELNRALDIQDRFYQEKFKKLEEKNNGKNNDL